MRTKLAVDNLSTVKPYVEFLTEWEQEFLFGIMENDRVHRLSRKEFNILHGIAVDVKKRFIRELAG